MAQYEPCDKCDQKTSCREVFRQLGKTQEKSMVCSVLAAFVVPLAVFIACLAMLTRYIDSSGVAFLAAFIITAFCVIIIKIISKRLGRKEK
jgi:positive regulator of sigma E activity